MEEMLSFFTFATYANQSVVFIVPLQIVYREL